MLVFVLIFFMLGRSASTYCNHKTCNSGNISVTMEPMAGVPGRYTLQQCAPVPRPDAPSVSWMVYLLVNDKPQSSCTDYNSDTDQSALHSSFKREVPVSSHCKYECHSIQLDLVFTGCYVIKSKIIYKNGSECVLLSYVNSLWIENEIMDSSNFTNTTYICDAHSDGNDVIAHLFSKQIPITTYRISLERKPHTPEDPYLSVAQQCEEAHATFELHCWLRAVPPGAYNLQLDLTAPWTDSPLFENKSHIDCPFTHVIDARVDLPRLVEEGGGGGGSLALWLGASAGVAAVLVLLAVLVCRRRPPRSTVLRGWRERYKHVEEMVAKESCRAVLLLYARDCRPFMDAMAQLRHCLRHYCAEKVYDLFEPSCQAEMAPSPTEWVHALLRRDDVKVVFVETPVAAELYNAALVDGDDDAPPGTGGSGGLTLGAPLLWSRVAYRSPQPGDSLLQYAVRLVKQTAHAQLAYRKYYVASVNTTAEVLPNVAPYRRYPLPGAGRLLLEHVAGAPPAPPASAPPAQLDALAAALQRYARHLADHPDYMRDHLLLL